MQGLFITGECLGTKKNDRSYKDKDTGQIQNLTIYQVGIKIPKPNGFEGETETLSITLSKTQVESNLFLVLEKFKSKIITVPVYVHAYFSPTNSKAGYEIRLSGDGIPVE